MPSSYQAHQFALMVSAGLPSHEAIRYFVEDEEHAAAQHMLWVRSREVQDATLAIQGKAWQDMTTDERIQTAITKTYNEMAYFLYSRNYVELVGSDKAKADTCRQALEVKLAGLSGKLDPLSRFWDDVRTGRVSLVAAAKAS